MDKKLNELIQKIYNEKKTDYSQDVKYLGTMSTEIETKTGKETITQDVFVLIEKMPTGHYVHKFYDENGNYLAARDYDGVIYPSRKLADGNLDYLNQLKDMCEQYDIDAHELDEKLEKISNLLGIQKDEILAMSSFDSEQELDSDLLDKEQDEKQITLDSPEDTPSEEKKEENENKLGKIDSKEEVNLDKKIDDKHSLGEILGIPPGSKLIAVYSSSIAENENSTRYSFIIKSPDGNLKPADMLEQTGGKDSDKNIYETNRDGSKVEKHSVKSSYKINSPLIENGILTATIGDYGYIDISYGQIDRTSNMDAFTQKLETAHDRYTTREVREEFSSKKGIDNVTRKLDEAEEHENHGCSEMTLNEIDGDPNTGHNHEDAIAKIKEFDHTISDVFTDEEINERFVKKMDENPSEELDKVISITARDLAEDAEHIRSPQNR